MNKLKTYKTVLFFALFLIAQAYRSQTIDTLIGVGNHIIHFHVLKGKGMPILFEAGAGNDGSIWDTILPPIINNTGATVITYDRAGFGKSSINNTDTSLSKHGLLSGIDDLELGLKKLGFGKQIMLVSHSYGGYYSTLYSVRHPDLVKSIVLIDINHNFYSNQVYLAEEIQSEEQSLSEWKKNNPGLYYLHATIGETAKMMESISIPLSIPVVDIISGIPVFEEKDKLNFYRQCHRKFVDSHPKSIEITAYQCHHYVWQDNPNLIVNIISKAYAETLEEKRKTEVYQRALTYAISSCNEVKKANANYNHSEENLTEWGIELFRAGEVAKAIEILKLNVTLFPLRWEAYEILAEALQKDNNKEEAIKMYKKSIEMNPGNEDGKKSLEQLLSK
jgi:tetratricopeptide (TPR) repeat protein